MAGSGKKRGFLRMMGLIVMSAGGAYCAYRLLNSRSFARRKSQLLRLLRLFSVATHSSAESAALISSDLQHFLTSDSDHVPRSLRQCFKLAHCSEFQIAFALVSAAVARGFIGEPLHSRQTCSDEDPRDLACKDIREVFVSASIPSSGEVLPCAEFECDWQRRNGDYFPSYSGTLRSHSLELRKALEEITNRISDKLFSEAGVAFASSVTSTLASNFASAIFKGTENPSLHNASANISSIGYEQESSHSSNLIGVLCSEKFKELVADCVHVFASTAVSVYIEKTKDLNFYDDVVAGITNPAYKDPMKDILTSICNGAVETFIKTSRNIAFAERSQHTEEKNDLHEPIPNAHMQSYCREIAKNSDFNSKASESSEMKENTWESWPDSVLKDSGLGFISELIPKYRGNDSNLRNVIGGVSKALAINRNHKLVVKVASTVIVDAVVSFTNAVLNAISRHTYRNVLDELTRFRKVVTEQLTDGETSRAVGEIIIKAFLLGSICFGVWLFVLTNFQMERYD